MSRGTRNRVSIVITLAVVAGLTYLLVSSLAAGTTTAPGDKDVKASAREVKPLVGADERMTIPDDVRVSGNGIVEPADRAIEVASEVPGRIRKIHVSEGQVVQAGQALLELELGPQEAAVAAAEAELAVAKAQLLRSRRGNRSSQVREARAQAQSAEARLQLAEEDVKRNAPLAETGAISGLAFTRLERQRDQARADLEATQARATLLASGSRREDIAIARAQLQAAEARLQQQRASLAQRHVMAPSRGEVLQLKVRAGEYYQPGGQEPLVVVGDTSTLRVRLDIDERDVGKIAAGDKVIVQAVSYPGRNYEGQIAEIGRKMGRKNIRSDDPVERVDTKILEVVVTLDSFEGLLPGLRVRGYIVGRRR